MSQTILVQIKEIESITIANENHTVIGTNSIVVSYVPNPGDSYENYEILLGTSIDTMNPYAITRERNIDFSGLDFNT
jgi:hypothetical protein